MAALLRGGGLLGAVSVLAGGTALAQAIGIVVAPVLTRLYRPADFGVLAIYASLLGIVSNVVALKYNLAIPLPRRSRHAVNLLAVSLVVVIAMSGTTALAVLVAREFTDLPASRQLGGWAWLLPLGLLGTGVYNSLQYWAIRTRQFTLIARTKLSQAAGQSLVQLGLGFAGLAPAGLLLGHLAGQTNGVGALARRLWSVDQDSVRQVTIGRMRAIERRYRSFSLLASAAGIFNSAGLYAAPLLLAGLYDVKVAGWFALAERMVKLPATLLGSSVSQAYYGHIAGLADQPHRLASLLNRTAAKLAMIIALPTLAIGFLARPLFGFVFGPEWLSAGSYAQLLALPMFFGFSIVSVALNLDVLDRQGLSLGWSVTRLTIVVLSLAVPAALDWSPFVAIGCYSAGMCFSYITLFLINHYAISGQIADMKPREAQDRSC